MLDQNKYLFYGFGSEYVLHDLYDEISRLGFDCIEVDVLGSKNSRKIINSLEGKKIIFITSAHFLIDKKNFTDFYANNNFFYSVIEILKILKPKHSIFIPHDLTQPLISYEVEFLNQFDLFLSPCEPFTSIYSQYCKTREVGWIKYSQKKSEDLAPPSHQAIWLLSDYTIYNKIGKEESYKQLSPVLKQGVSIKFPKWFNSDNFKNYFKKKDVIVYPSSNNSVDLILDHKIIITNGLSSINTESCWLGKTTVNIIENSHYGNEKKYLEELLPNLQFVDKIEEFKLDEVSIKKGEILLKPFDMKQSIDLITRS